jgi:hypothetical protein
MLDWRRDGLGRCLSQPLHLGTYAPHALAMLFLYFEFGPKFGSKILNIFIVLNGFGQLANALLA